MPHRIRGTIAGGAQQTVDISQTTPENFRFLIEQRGFQVLPDHLDPMTGLNVTGIDQSGFTVPGTIFNQSVGPAIRDAIERGVSFLFGNPTVNIQGEGPVRDLPGVPDFIDRMLSGTLPRGATAFIQLPNGTTGCPSGYHPEKQDKPYCVRNRRMNALNPRALSRASRRVGGFARAVKRARTLKKVCKSL